MLRCAPNFRAVSARVAGVTPRLFRADVVLTPNEADRATLAQCDIGVVFDLRSATERTNHPNRYWFDQGVEVIGIDLLAQIEGGADPWTRLRARADAPCARDVMTGMYAAFPGAAHGQLLSVVAAICQAPGAALIHCTAGKDRTGFVVALLLSVLGSPREQIMTDYLRSAARANPAARAATRTLAANRLGFALSEPALDELMSVQAAFLEASFAAIDRDHAGLDGYLASAGVTSANRAELERAMLS